jgi:putative colanic acid biosynthesis acetyltransferase WcaB
MQTRDPVTPEQVGTSVRTAQSSPLERTGWGNVRHWVFQDWSVNRGRPECQLLLAWFRVAQWAACRWGRFARLAVWPYWLLSSLMLGVDLPAAASIGPRLRLYHLQGIVINPHATIGSDCRLRHGVTVGNRVDRNDRELGVATIGDDVELGTGCVVLGDVHVGDHARVGALAVVIESVPAWGVAVGNPARVIRIDEPQESK